MDFYKYNHNELYFYVNLFWFFLNFIPVSSSFVAHPHQWLDQGVSKGAHISLLQSDFLLLSGLRKKNVALLWKLPSTSFYLCCHLPPHPIPHILTVLGLRSSEPRTSIKPHSNSNTISENHLKIHKESTWYYLMDMKSMR